MCVATEQWLEREFRVPYTLEQIRMLADAVSQGRTAYPKEKGDEILADFGLDGKKKEKWTSEEKAAIRDTLKEVGTWPRLAEDWLAKTWQKN